ncbi:MAG: hypothetical protein KQH53_11710 [Desulfarculaceae bacterium]|nr:hypothetical protein [Desulfarculaceae bacterium]
MGQNEMWSVEGTIFRLESRWLTLVVERVLDDKKNLLEYWRVEKADSLIVVPLYKDRVILPAPQYRHGLHELTEDLPGGRVEAGTSLHDGAFNILERELGCPRDDVVKLECLSSDGWAVNSSFSDQRLHVYRAILDSDANRPPLAQATDYAHDQAGCAQLFERLWCLQCRAALLESLRQQ